MVLVSVPPAVQAGTITLHPIADTFGNVNAPDIPQGSQAGLVSGTSVFMSPVWDTYLKFDLTPLGSAVITGAALSLYQVDGYAPFARGGGTNLSRFGNDAWSEDTLTWNNQPALGPSALFAWNADDGLYRGWSTWTWTPTAGDPILDLTPGNGLLSLFLMEDFHTADAHTWLARDYVNYPGAIDLYGADKMPFLTITTLETTGIPEPSTLILIGCGLAGLSLARRRRT